MTLKREVDQLVSWPLLFLVSPVLLIACVAIYLEDRGNPLFKQWRMGANRIPFQILKLRTMPVNSPQMHASEAMIEPTRVGRFLRRWKIDELMQLRNVINDEMSLVGPRPAMLTQNILLKLRADLGVEDLKPGMTGLAQVNRIKYNNEYEEAVQKTSFDLAYKEKMNFWTDLYILFLTIGRVLL